MAVDFRSKQAEFAGYIRNPQENPMPADVAPERMVMYRELFFNNVDSFLSSNFPVLRTLLDDEQWYELAQDFYARHICTTPHFSQIAEEFLDFLQNERSNAGDYPFLLELAHYEWVEMALSIAQDQVQLGDQSFVDDVLNRPLRLSTLAWPLAYHYPVERISPDYLPTQAPAQPTYLIVYRDAEDNVRFMQTTALTFRLLQLMQQQPGSGQGCLQALADETSQIDAASLLEFGRQTLQELATKGIIIPGE